MMEPDLTAKEVLRLEAKFWHDRADALEAEIELLKARAKEMRGVLRNLGVYTVVDEHGKITWARYSPEEA